jgi:hypothetical protein
MSGPRPHISNLGQGYHHGAVGQRLNLTWGCAIQGEGKRTPDPGPGYQGTEAEQLEENPIWTSAGRCAVHWLRLLAERLERVRIIHGDWKRCLNYNYGGNDTAIFLDPPYAEHEYLYGDCAQVAVEVGQWAKANAQLRIAICGHQGDYDLPGWEIFDWSHGRVKYAGSSISSLEVIWFSPGCVQVELPNLIDDLG